MLFYIIFIFVLLLLEGNYRIGSLKKPSFFTQLGVVVIILVLACRFDIGADYSQYFQNYVRAYQKNEIPNYEPLNGLLFYLSIPFASPSLLIAIYAILTGIIVYYAIKQNAKNFFIGIFTYVALFYLSAFSTIRQGIALSIVLFSYRYLKDKSYLKYFCCITIATLFHYSAAIGVFFPILYQCKPKYLILVLGLSSVVFIGGIGILSKIPYVGKYAIYLSETTNFGGGNMQKLFIWGIIAFLWLVKARNDKDSTPVLVLITFGCIFPILLGAHIGGRLSQYMYVFLCIAAPNILIAKNIIYRTIYISVIIVWFLGYVYVGTDGDYSKAFLPYQTIFEVDTSSPTFKI